MSRPLVRRDVLAADLQRRFTIDHTDVALGDWTVRLEKPQNADVLISEADYVKDERLPYWADLWPASVELARYLVAHGPAIAAAATARRGAASTANAIELGCGLGLVSIAAMRAGFEAFATDYYDDACNFAAHNAYAAHGRAPATQMVDWTKLPADLGTFDLVLAADVLYEPRYAALVANAVVRTLAPGGVFVLGDQGRVALPAFIEEAAARGIAVRAVHTVEPPAGVQAPRITIYEGRRT